MKATHWVLHEAIYCGSTQIRSHDEATWMSLFHCMAGKKGVRPTFAKPKVGRTEGYQLQFEKPI